MFNTCPCCTPLLLARPNPRISSLPNSFFLPAIAAILVVPISRPTMIGDSELSCSFFGSVTETFVPWFIDMCFSCLLFIKIFYGLRIKILYLAVSLYSSPVVSLTCTFRTLVNNEQRTVNNKNQKLFAYCLFALLPFF